MGFALFRAALWLYGDFCNLIELERLDDELKVRVYFLFSQSISFTSVTCCVEK